MDYPEMPNEHVMNLVERFEQETKKWRRTLIRGRSDAVVLEYVDSPTTASAASATHIDSTFQRYVVSSKLADHIVIAKALETALEGRLS